MAKQNLFAAKISAIWCSYYYTYSDPIVDKKNFPHESRGEKFSPDKNFQLYSNVHVHVVLIWRLQILTASVLRNIKFGTVHTNRLHCMPTIDHVVPIHAHNWLVNDIIVGFIIIFVQMQVCMGHMLLLLSYTCCDVHVHVYMCTYIHDCTFLEAYTP